MLNFTLIKLSLYLMGGVVLGFYFRFGVEILLLWGIGILILFFLSYLRARKKFFKDVFFGICTFLVFGFIGILTTCIHLPENQPKHYINHLSLLSEEDILFAEISEKLKPGTYQDKFIVKVRGTREKNLKGKILVNVARDTNDAGLEIGDVIAVPAKLRPVNTPLNPHQFDYSAYMENLRVLRQLNLTTTEILVVEKNVKGLQATAGNIRGAIVEKLRKSALSQEELAIVQALLLGQRQEISKDIYEHYAAAGVIHILAVSGLHVGIILLLLNWILKPLDNRKNGKILKVFLLMILLWCFAVIAGLSPSVVRAVTMFSFIAIGMQLNRRTNVLNTLFMSLLFLLLIDPYFILQVGFQLSYAAVFSIVLIQPLISKLYNPENTLLKYLWGILTVTIAAQAGVLPLSLLYFHQFPGLFFISNLVILPFLGLILGLGLLICALALLNSLPSLLAEFYGLMISTLNNFVSWIASKEEFLFRDIYFSMPLCISFYLLIFSIVLFFRKIRASNLVLVLFAVMAVQLSFIYEKTRLQQNEAVVFHKSRNTVLGFKEGKNLNIFHNLDTTAASQLFINSYKTAINSGEENELALKNLYDFYGKRIFIIDSSGIYDVPGLQPDLLILTNSPRINLERVILKLNPSLIVADGSNYRSFIAQWKETAEKRKLPFHATGETGAFILTSD